MHRPTPYLISAAVIFLITVFSCNTNGGENGTSSWLSGNAPEENINSYLDTMLCDGFDFPVGDKNGKGEYVSKQNNTTYSGWYIATNTGEEYSVGIHTGEDWNGNGGGNTDLGQPVYAVAKGEVLTAENYGSPWGKVVYVRHKYLENGALKECYSLYAHLDQISVKEGDIIKRRQKIGTIGTGEGAHMAHLHLEIRKNKMKNYEVTYWPSSNGKDKKWVLDYYEQPSSFIKEHRILTVPSKEKQCLIAIKHEYKMYVLQKGVIKHTYDIALSQSPIGHKQKQGDNKLPEGEYKIIQKAVGPFTGDYAEYLGPRWMRMNYPNAFDANAAYKKGTITKDQRDKIVTAIKNNTEPPKNTALGGGIGIHGWIASDWIADGTQNQTWGCVSMHNEELIKFYPEVELYTKIIICP